MLMVFVNPMEIAIVDLLTQDTSLTAIYFGNNVILLLVNRYAQQLGDIGGHKLHLYFDNSKCHTVWHIQEQMASYRCVPGPHPRIHPT
jgi:hypothetical protein